MGRSAPGSQRLSARSRKFSTGGKLVYRHRPLSQRYPSGAADSADFGGKNRRKQRFKLSDLVRPAKISAKQFAEFEQDGLNLVPGPKFQVPRKPEPGT